MSQRLDYDVVVIGARCAGAAHARLLAQAGFSTLVVDRAEQGSDTLSSHTMTRGGVQQLDRWGLLDGIVASGTPGISRSLFQFGDHSFPIDIRPVQSGPGMIAPRRSKLDAVLGQSAEAAGAEFRYRTTFQEAIRDDTGRVRGVRLSGTDGWEYSVRADFVVGADGLQSSFARHMGVQHCVISPNAHSHLYGYFNLPGQVDNQMIFGRGVSVGLTPTDDGMTIAIVSCSPDRMRSAMRTYGAEGALLKLAAKANAEIGERLQSAQMNERTRLFAGHPTMRRKSSGPGWALIGDAGQFRDPVTAHGMTDAFRDAEHLATHLMEIGYDATGYEVERNAVSDPIFNLTAKMTEANQPYEALAMQFKQLSALMRDEQAWMEQRFRPQKLAA